ncbi:MAG: hypothetical protein MI919_34895 [Holophagales bacterium]|nr:hypothetical protein [Holophagales bacterium]
MPLDPPYRDLYLHMEWADASIWRTVLASEVLRGDLALRELLQHIYVVQSAFLSLWQGEAVDAEAGQGLDAEALAGASRARHAGLQSHLGGLRPGDLDSRLDLPWAARIRERLGQDPAPSQLRDTVLQVCFHTQHHRGQACAAIRRLDVTPPLVDFIAWIWSGRPEADWD